MSLSTRDDALMADSNFDPRITLAERRMYATLEALDPETLKAIWKVALPEKPMPADEHVELGYALYEYFAGC